MCPPDEASEDGLAPCFKCPRGFFQPERGRRHCLRSAAQKKVPAVVVSLSPSRFRCPNPECRVAKGTVSQV